MMCGTGVCAKRCNGRSECAGGEDERDCCRTDQFVCGDGRCLEAVQECDGRKDCRDETDEHSGCGTSYMFSLKLVVQQIFRNTCF